MISILTLTLALGATFSGHAGAAPRTELLTFDEVTRMSDTAQRVYFRNLGEFLATVERLSEGKYDQAARLPAGHRALVARWFELLASIPVASAGLESTAAGPRADYVDPPPKKMKKPIVDQCPPQPRDCSPLDQTERGKLVREFRASETFNRCIAGGFFTKKIPPSRAGSCEMRTEFKFAPTEPDGPIRSFTCGENMVLCNPVLFCIEFAGINTPRGPRDSPSSICVRRGPHVTQTCFNKYRRIVAGRELPDLEAYRKNPSPAYRSAYRQMRRQKARACNPFRITLQSLRNEYALLKDETESYYRGLCGDDSTFAKLFCQECRIIGERLHALLAQAGHGCGASEAPTVPPPTGASKEAKATD